MSIRWTLWYFGMSIRWKLCYFGEWIMRKSGYHNERLASIYTMLEFDQNPIRPTTKQEHDKQVNFWCDIVTRLEALKEKEIR